LRSISPRKCELCHFRWNKGTRTRSIWKYLMRTYQNAYLSTSNSVFYTIYYRKTKGCTSLCFDCNHLPRIHPLITWSAPPGHCLS
uniref:Ovule protein n=1 Tax=Taenia asiatica TaxID=60517 RepID=A0A0R3VZU0_TAEAS